MSRAKKPEEVMRFYDEALRSMHRYPGEWLALFHSKMAACKDDLGRQMWQAGAKHCRCIIAHRRGNACWKIGG